MTDPSSNSSTHIAHTLFISDLHLSPDRPATTSLFFQFLKNTAPQAEALYILGDLFDVWIGDDDQNDFIDSIKTALRGYTQGGTPTYFMHGNRDFLIGKQFARETGLSLLKEPTIVHLYGKRCLLLHGDSLCTLDKQHQRSRAIMHNSLCQKLALQLPLSIRKRGARYFRSNSTKRNARLSSQIMDVTPSAVIQALSTAQATLLIHGHTHRPAMHTHAMPINDQLAQRIVLGAWHNEGVYLRADRGGSLELLTESYVGPPPQ